jgi:hypothetical protein
VASKKKKSGVGTNPRRKSTEEFIRSALGSTEREPGWEYGTVLPVRVREDKSGKKEREWGLGYSDTAKGMLEAVTAPRKAMQGKEFTPEEAMEFAMNVTAPGVATARYAPGVVNMPMIKLGGSRSPSTAYKNFMDDFQGTTTEHPFDNQARIFNNSATVSVSKGTGDDVHIHDIRSLQPGSGSETLAYLKSLADKHGIALTGIAKAYAKSPQYPMSTQQLRDYYKRRGFSVKKGSASEGYPIEYRPKKSD